MSLDIGLILDHGLGLDLCLYLGCSLKLGLGLGLCLNIGRIIMNQAILRELWSRSRARAGAWSRSRSRCD